MSVNFDDLRKSIKRPRQAVDLCLRGDLVAQRARLLRDIAASQSRASESIAGDPQLQQLQAKLAEVDAEMTRAIVSFTFEALSRDQFTQLEDAHKYRDDGSPTRELESAIVAASMIDPDLTAEQVSTLFADLSDGQVSELVGCAWGVNRESGTVPFVASASEPIV